MAGCTAALRDWARFRQLHLQDGVWQGLRLLPEDWVALATQPNGETGVFYRYQSWLFGEGRYSAEGVHGQFIFVDPAHETVIARRASGRSRVTTGWQTRRWRPSLRSRGTSRARSNPGLRLGAKATSGSKPAVEAARELSRGRREES